jgi:hypothetical protein
MNWIRHAALQINDGDTPVDNSPDAGAMRGGYNEILP